MKPPRPTLADNSVLVLAASVGKMPGHVLPLPEVCVDAGDFNRTAFHKEFNAAVVAFFRRHLIKG